MINYQDTSREALAAFGPYSGTLDDQILKALEEIGPATCEQIENRIARSHQAVSGNLRHLVERERVKKSGHFGYVASGRKAILWQLV